MKIDFEKLKKMVGNNNVKNDIADLYIYGSDASVHEAFASAVVGPTSVEQVQAIVRYANA